jgi:hypothetical protein
VTTDAPSPITWLVEEYETFDGLPADAPYPTGGVRPVPVTIPYPTHGMFVGRQGICTSHIQRVWLARLFQTPSGYDVVLIDGRDRDIPGERGHLRLLDAAQRVGIPARLGVWAERGAVAPGLTLYDGNPASYWHTETDDPAAIHAAYVAMFDALAHAPPAERPCVVVLDNMGEGDDANLAALAPALTALLDALDVQGRALWLTLHDGATMLTSGSPLAPLLPRLPMRVLLAPQMEPRVIAGLGFDPLLTEITAARQRTQDALHQEKQRRWAVARESQPEPEPRLRDIPGLIINELVYTIRHTVPYTIRHTVPYRLLPLRTWGQRQFRALLRGLRLAPPPAPWMAEVQAIIATRGADPRPRLAGFWTHGYDGSDRWRVCLRTPDGAVVHGYASPRSDEEWLLVRSEMPC